MPKISKNFYIILLLLLIMTVLVAILIVFSSSGEDLEKNKGASASSESHKVAAEWYINLIKKYNYGDGYIYTKPRAMVSRENSGIVKEGITNIEKLRNEPFPRSMEEVINEWLVVEGRTLALIASGCPIALSGWTNLVFPDPDNTVGFNRAGVDMDALEKHLDTDSAYLAFIKSGGINPVFEYNRRAMTDLLNECAGYDSPLMTTGQQAHDIIKEYMSDPSFDTRECQEALDDTRIRDKMLQDLRFVFTLLLDDSETFGPIMWIPVAGWLEQGGWEDFKQTINDNMKKYGYSCVL